MDQWSKTTSHQKHGIGIPCSTENFVPIVVPGLSSSSSGSSSTSKTPSRQESHSSSSSSTSSSSPTVSEIQTRAREDEDRTESDISPVTVSTTVDERSGRPYIDQANKKPKKQCKKRNPRRNRATRCLHVLKSRSGCARIQRNLVDDEIPEHGDSHASSSHEASLEPILCKHYTSNTAKSYVKWLRWKQWQRYNIYEKRMRWTTAAQTKMTRATCSSPSTTPLTTLTHGTPTIAWCTCIETARIFVHN